MDHLGQKVLRHFVTFMLLAVTCYAQETDTCEVIPKNQTVKLGSNVTVVFKAPLSGICRKKMNDFHPSKVFWTLNSKKIEESYYDHNSTYARVTIANFSLESGTVESHMYGQVLGGTILRTYDTSSNTRRGIQPPKKPINIHCVTNLTTYHRQYTTCYWDEAGDSPNTRYSVTMKQDNRTRGHCKSQPGQNHCRLSEYADTFSDNMMVTMTAENSAGNVSATVHFHPWKIAKFDPPRSIQVEPLPTSLSVDWEKTDCPHNDKNEKCEVQCVEEGTNVTIVSNKTSPQRKRTIYVDDVKPCTNYTVAVRCACHTSLWSDWSARSTVLSALNVSSVPFHLWRRVLERYENGTRRVQLMWKGSFCNLPIEYRLSVDSRNVGLDRTSVLLDGKAHEIEIAAYNNSKMLRHSFLKIPAIGKDMPPVRTPLATSRNGLIYISWEAPPTPVNDYVIEWLTDATQDAMPSWEKTQETNISFPGLSQRLYTVTITPLYEDGPGQERILHTYAEEGAPAKVRRVSVTKADSTWLTVDWEAVGPDQCCGFVVNYTVFYRDSNGPELSKSEICAMADC